MQWPVATGVAVHPFWPSSDTELPLELGYGARFWQKFTLEAAIELHAFAPLEASRRVTNGIPPGWHSSDWLTL
jgi:hypothetical protein